MYFVGKRPNDFIIRRKLLGKCMTSYDLTIGVDEVLTFVDFLYAFIYISLSTYMHILHIRRFNLCIFAFPLQNAMILETLQILRNPVSFV